VVVLRLDGLGAWERAAMLAFMRENGETHDWWEAAGRRKR